MGRKQEIQNVYIPKGELEENIVYDLNDFSWFDEIPFAAEDGIIFTAGGLFYHFEKEQVRKLFCAMAGNSTDSYFSLEHPKEKLESWSE